MNDYIPRQPERRVGWASGDLRVSIKKLSFIVVSVSLFIAFSNQVMGWFSRRIVGPTEDIAIVATGVTSVREDVNRLKLSVDSVKMEISSMREILEFNTYVNCIELKLNEKYDTYIPPVCRNIQARVMSRVPK